MNIQKYLDLFEYQKDDTSDLSKLKEGYWCFKHDVISDKNPLYQKLSNLMYESDLDEDSRYLFTVEALKAIKSVKTNYEPVNGSKFTEDDYTDSERVSEFSEAPIYNSELTEWLSKGTNWTFVDDVISEYGEFDSDTSIITVIQLAYSKAWEEHYYKVLEAIQ